MKRKNVFWVAYFTFFMILAMPTRTWAYVDPATLTYVIQIVAGVFIAGGVAVSIYWRKIKKFFTRDKEPKGEKKVNSEDRVAMANAAAAAADLDTEGEGK